jgi:predicted RNase H-like HicB family nuclease
MGAGLHAVSGDVDTVKEVNSFDPGIVEQAAALAARFPIQLRRDRNGYAGTVRELPSVLGYGQSKAAALDATRDLLKWALAYLIETGRAPTPCA